MVGAKIAGLPRGGDRGNQHTGGKGSIEPLISTRAKAAAGDGARTEGRGKRGFLFPQAQGITGGHTGTSERVEVGTKSRACL